METSARSPFHGVAAGWLLPMGSRALAERIARTVVRAFYDDVHVVVFDALLVEKEQPAKDTDIAEHIRLPPKLVRTTLQKLKRDGLVFERSQKQAAGAKKSSVFLWGFDHDKFPRVFRYRMLMMRRAATEKLRSAIEEERFTCPNESCYMHERGLTTMEAMQVRKQIGATEFACEICSAPLVKMRSPAASSDIGTTAEDIKARLNRQMMQLEAMVTNLLQVMYQEKQDAAAARPDAKEPVRPGTSALAGTETISVKLEESGAPGLLPTPVASRAASVALPWEASASSAVADGDDAVEPPTSGLAPARYEEILRQQEADLEEEKRQLQQQQASVPPEERDEALSSVVTVTVQGVVMPLDTITEEHFAAMTDDEYRRYEEIVQKEGDYHDEFG